MKGFKKCPNGHIYRDDQDKCPYCSGEKRGFSTGITTQSNFDDSQRTRIIPGLDGDVTKTDVIDDSQPVRIQRQSFEDSDMMKTSFQEEVYEEDERGNVSKRTEYRRNTRLVGWLVTYSLDPLGIDYKIYEGKNYIGKNYDCSICVNDPMVSGRHAIILFRANKFILKDNLSTNGTFVNNEDIEDAQYEIHDGDIIQVGQTYFKFRSAI